MLNSNWAKPHHNQYQYVNMILKNEHLNEYADKASKFLVRIIAFSISFFKKGTLYLSLVLVFNQHIFPILQSGKVSWNYELQNIIKWCWYMVLYLGGKYGN